jgi:hypothetical protein
MRIAEKKGPRDDPGSHAGAAVRAYFFSDGRTSICSLSMGL